jgi:hypothetical protein
MQLVELALPTQRPDRELAAVRMKFEFNTSLERRVNDHKKGFRDFWDNPKVTPDEILEEWGAVASIMIAAASESFQHIARLAAIRGMSVDEFIPPSLYEPRRPYVFHEDGTVTLEEVYGHDAWGRFIPVPEDPQRTGYLTDQTPVYGKYPDGTYALVPLPEGAFEWSFDREPIYGYEEDGTPILTPPAPEPTPEP